MIPAEETARIVAQKLNETRCEVGLKDIDAAVRKLCDGCVRREPGAMCFYAVNSEIKIKIKNGGAIIAECPRYLGNNPSVIQIHNEDGSIATVIHLKPGQCFSMRR